MLAKGEYMYLMSLARDAKERYQTTRNFWGKLVERARLVVPVENPLVWKCIRPYRNNPGCCLLSYTPKEDWQKLLDENCKFILIALPEISIKDYYLLSDGYELHQEAIRRTIEAKYAVKP